MQLTFMQKHRQAKALKQAQAIINYVLLPILIIALVAITAIQIMAGKL